GSPRASVRSSPLPGPSAGRAASPARGVGIVGGGSDGALGVGGEYLDALAEALEEAAAALQELDAFLVARDRGLERDLALLELGDDRLEAREALVEGGFGVGLRGLRHRGGSLVVRGGDR